MDGRIFEKKFSFCFSLKELTRAVISLVRTSSSDLWARKTVQNSFENSNSYFSSWFSLLSAVNMNIVSIVTFWNFFWTVFRAQRSYGTFRTREMTARVSSFTLKQKEKCFSKKRPSIWGKTIKNQLHEASEKQGSRYYEQQKSTKSKNLNYKIRSSF